MTYTKTNWVDEVLAGAERFDIKDNGGTPINSNVQIVLATSVSVPGTSVDAANLNHLEQGIEDAQATDKTLRSTDDGTTPTSGTGIEVFYDGTQGIVIAVDRTSPAPKPLRLEGSTVLLQIPISAPADSKLFGITDYGSLIFYLDEAGPNLKVKLKLSNGTVKTGTIALV